MASNPESIIPNHKLFWLRKNLFNSWFNSILTVICLIFLVWVIWGVGNWVISQAQWAVIKVNWRLFFVGRYPQSLYWRVWIALAVTSALGGLTFGVFSQTSSFKRVYLGICAFILGLFLTIAPLDTNSRLCLLIIAALAFVSSWIGVKLSKFIIPWISIAWLLSFLVSLWLINGGFVTFWLVIVRLRLGFTAVPTNLWNGLLLTLLMAFVSIVLSFPIGILLALGRTSNLPVVRWFCILYIEIIRGLPLIGILFLAQVMLPLFLPTDLRLDRVLRAIAGLVIFSAAYMAENVRGGLQAIPRGQIEAAKALGLNSYLVVLLIILPQALRAVIPAIVGQFIGLFKDTSLLSLVGLVELTGIARSIVAQPQFLGRYAEVYLFIGLIYWVFCYSMSLVSKKLERQF
jgi:general L-amino acid transport system permease protein